MFKSVTAICWYWDPKLKYFESSLVNTIVVKIVILTVASDTSIGTVYLHLNKTPKLSFEIESWFGHLQENPVESAHVN